MVGKVMSENFKLIVDTREEHQHQGSTTACMITKLNELKIPYSKEMLPCGDYIIENVTTGGKCVIERKTIDDFVLSVLNGRLMQEVEKMNEIYSKSFLIIEGSWSDFYKNRAKLKKMKYIKNINSFTVGHRLGVMASISARTNTKILQTETQEQTIQLMISLASKLTDGKTFRAPEFKRSKTEEKIYLNVLHSFPGVSINKAEKIIEKYPSWQDFTKHISAGTFELEGFGKKSIEMFKNFVIGEKAKV